MTRGRRMALLCAITLASLALHGYHTGTDDAAIYAPGIKRAADPSLYPFGSEFFMHHAGLSLFPPLVAAATRVARLPVEWSMVLWYALTQFLLVWAAYELARRCFRNERARWAGVGLLAAVLSVPVAGTALLIADPYLTARSLSTPLGLMAVGCFLAGRNRIALAWLAATFLIHPQMALYCAGFGVLHAMVSRRRERLPAAEPAMVLPALFLPFMAVLQPAHGAYREVLASRAYFLVTTWHWWEWAGVLAPLLILAACARVPLQPVLPGFSRLAKTSIGLGLLAVLLSTLLATRADFAYLLRMQPMRGFHLIYMVMFILLGGLAGEYVLHRRVWRWLLCFGALAAGMLTLEIATYPASPHFEWPGIEYRSEWMQAFLWIRDHTPKDAVFALDPEYLLKPGLDLHGFRAVAERSMLADREKDSGASSVFPELAEEWKRQSAAGTDWAHVSAARIEQLRKRYGVSWVILDNSAAPGDFDCPYRNREVRVCRVPVRM